MARRGFGVARRVIGFCRRGEGGREGVLDIRPEVGLGKSGL